MSFNKYKKNLNINKLILLSFNYFKKLIDRFTYLRISLR